MQQKKLGRTDLSISALCLGTMTFGAATDQDEAFNIMDAALDAGITCFDTADIYSFWVDGNQGGESEQVIGAWLQARPRDRVMIATKVRGRMWAGPDGEGLSRAHIVRAVEDSLRRLQTDYIDLYQTHWYDDHTPLEETFAALDELVQSGKVRTIGASNHPAARLTEALQASAANDFVRYESLQPHHSLLHRTEFEAELAALCMEHDMSVIPYSPLAAGFLTGKYTREQRDAADSERKSSGTVQRLLNDDRAYDVLDVVREIADDHGVPMAQVALAWQMSKPFITAPIVGARTVEQLQQTVGAADLTLSEDEIKRLDDISAGF